MPFARELRMFSLALLDSTGATVSRPSSWSLMQLGNSGGYSTGLRNLCSYQLGQSGLLSVKKSVMPYLLSSRALQTEVVDKNLIYKKSAKDFQNIKDNKKKPLVIILAWMMAKAKHLEKYSEIYLSKGFDVLIVNMPPMDLLFPVTGSQVIAKNVLDFLKKNSQYENLLVHGFSVGAYLFGEILVKAKENPEEYQPIMDRFKGLIFDSAVDFEGLPKGFPRAVTTNPILSRMLEWYTNTHLKLMHDTATKHYLKSSQNFHFRHMSCPSLLIVSERDPVGNPTDNRKVASNWLSKGIEVEVKCFKDSIHCSHMIKYPKEYVEQVEKFLTKVGFGSSTKSHL